MWIYLFEAQQNERGNTGGSLYESTTTACIAIIAMIIRLTSREEKNPGRYHNRGGKRTERSHSVKSKWCHSLWWIYRIRVKAWSWDMKLQPTGSINDGQQSQTDPNEGMKSCGWKFKKIMNRKHFILFIDRSKPCKERRMDIRLFDIGVQFVSFKVSVMSPKRTGKARQDRRTVTVVFPQNEAGALF